MGNKNIIIDTHIWNKSNLMGKIILGKTIGGLLANNFDMNLQATLQRLKTSDKIETIESVIFIVCTLVNLQRKEEREREGGLG